MCRHPTVRSTALGAVRCNAGFAPDFKGSRRVACARVCALKSPEGFTLVELLVVIAVVGILASLLLPALSQTKEKGKSVRCVSNLRQLAIAATLHADDNEDTLPWSERHWISPSNPTAVMNYTD